MQICDDLQLYWARAQRCCSVAVNAAIYAGLQARSKLAVCPENLFSFCIAMCRSNAFSVEEYCKPSTAAVMATLGAKLARLSHLQEQIKSANYTIGRRIDHQSTPLLLRDE